MHAKSFVGIFSLLLFSFFWGYRGQDAFASFSTSVRGWWHSPAKDPVPPAENESPPPLPDSVGNNPPPAGIGAPGGAPQQVVYPGGPPVLPPNAIPPNGPGAQGVHQPQNSLANTLDSIRPGQVPPDQLARRNAYFQNLSQQLRTANANGAAPGAQPMGAQPLGAQPPVAAPPGPLDSRGVPPPSEDGFQPPPVINPAPYDAMPNGDSSSTVPMPPLPPPVEDGDVAQQTTGAVEELEEDDSDTEEADPDEDDAADEDTDTVDDEGVE